MRSKLSLPIAFFLAVTLPGQLSAEIYTYAGDVQKGSVSAKTKEWNGPGGMPRVLESSPETTLKVIPDDARRLFLAVNPEFTTVGRLIVGDPTKPFIGETSVAWTGPGTLTVTRGNGRPGEILLESPRDEHIDGAITTGCFVHVPLVAPNGLIFGGAGRGLKPTPEHPNDLHRLVLLGGIDANAACSKVGPAEVVLYGNVKIDGVLDVKDGQLVLSNRRDKDGKWIASWLTAKSIHAEPEATLKLHSVADDPNKPTLVLGLGEAGATPLVQCEGRFIGFELGALNLTTADGNPPAAGTYRLIEVNRPNPQAPQFSKVTINGGSLPSNCRMDYRPDGGSIDLIVEK